MFLEKLKESPKDKTLILATAIVFIPFILTTLVFCINEYELETSTSYGVLDFELAWTPDTINRIFTAWGPDEMEKQAFMTYVDFLYIPFYGLFGAGCVLLVSRKLEGKLQEVGLFMTLTPLIAGVFDAVENVNLLLMLDNEAYVRSFTPFIASLCATFKIGFLVAGICFLFIALILLIIIRSDKFSIFYIYLALIGSGILIVWLLSLWSLFISFTAGAIYVVMFLFIRWWWKTKPPNGKST